MLTRTTPGGSENSGSTGSREAKRIMMRLNWSMQLIALVGSLTAGEIARKAMSTICSAPNSTSCCKVLEGPMSNTARNCLLTSPVRRSGFEARRSGVPAGTKWPTCRRTWTCTWYVFVRLGSLALSSIENVTGHPNSHSIQRREMLRDRPKEGLRKRYPPPPGTPAAERNVFRSTSTGN